MLNAFTSKVTQTTNMRNNVVWYTNCARCSSRIANNGSGRPKKFCNPNCARQFRLNRCRVYSNKRARAAGIMPRPAARMTNRQLVIAEKRLRNECALHLQYWGVQEFVEHGFEYLMDMDHLDRLTKFDTIAKMMGSSKKFKGRKKNTGVSEQRFIDEMAKCQMLCMKCHRRKTVEGRDWVSMVKVLEPDMKMVYDQPTLFDI